MQIQKLNIPSTVNSPFLRRSSRIKSKYSPNSSESDTGSISSNQPTKNTRGRTATMDNIVSETLKGGRTRKASISSDISESTDIDILGTPKKRTTRSSLAATSTPTKINTRAASKRLIRAGSETKSPAVRTTRRTRASSVDPESLSEQNRSHPGTPIRKRVSLLMPESPVKEDEKKNLIPYVRLDTTIVEVDEFINSGNSDSSPDKALRSQQNQRIDKKRPNIHENEIEEDNSHESNKTSQLSKKRDETHDQYSDKITEDNETILVEESKSEENLPSSDSTTEMSTEDSFSNLSNSKKEEKLEINKNLSGIEISLKQSLTKELMIKVENLNTSVEEQKESPSNKENQTLNIINDTLESNIHSSTNVISLSTKSPTPIFANKSSNEKETKFTKNESNLNKRRHSKESTEATMKQCILSKEVIDDIEEKMDISADSSSSDLTCKQKCLDNLSVNDTTKRQSLVHEAECKSILSQEEDVGSVSEIIVKDKTPVKHISKSTDNIMEEITKSDKIEHTIMDTDSDVNKDSNKIELDKISCLSKNQNKTKQESDNKKRLSSISIIGDNKMKLMLEEQSLYQNENEASSNISHFNSDSTDLIVMSSVKNSNNQSNIMEKQSVIIQDNIIDNIDFTEQKRRNSKHAIESVLESSNAALKTSNSEFNESNEDNAIIQDIQPSNVTETSGKFAINMPCEKAETKSNYKNTVKQDLKRKSTDNIHLEKKKENLKLENQNDTNMNTDRDVIVDINVFHDITNDNSNKKNVEEELDIETNSVYSNLLKESESESEVECDLVLVDKKAWLDAENMKTAKEAESFEYDSDDTVLLKSRLDAKTTDHEQIIAKKLPMINEDLLENRIDAKVGNRNKKSLIEEKEIDCDNKIINSVSRMKKMINYKDSLSSTEDEDDLIAAVNKSINEFKTVSNQNNGRPVPRLDKSRQTFAKDERLFKIHNESDESIQSDDINELNKSLQVNKKNKSLSKSMERRKSLNKFPTKDMSSRQEAKATKNISINKSREDYSEKESDSTDAKKKTSKKKYSLNKTQNKDANTSESEEKNLSNLNAKTPTYLNDESDNDDNSEIIIPAMDFECRSYSTIACMGSDPNEESSDDESKNSIGIPSFLFAANSDSNIDSSTDVNTSIHSDIKREYNLDGKEQNFSDDNVPGDECRASESEVSDPDDDGSDLEDFIVNDDEIEEEDNEADDDDEEKDERNSEEENEQNMEEAKDAKEEEVDNESEIKQSVREENKVAKKKEVKDKSYEQAYIDAENVEEKDERDDILDGEDIEERLIKYIPLCFNTKMSSPEIKSPKIKRDIKKKKSDIMENKTILLDTSNLNSSTKNKSCMQKNEDIILLDTPNSSIKKKKKSNVQFSPKDVLEQLNKCEITSTRKLSKSRLSMECSTPKLDTYIRKYEEFNETLTIPERILEIQDTKIDNTKTAQDTSLKKKKSKKDSILKEDISLREFNQIDNEKKPLNSSLPSDLAEAVKKAGLSKPKFSKMGELQKTINITHTESPTIRYLIKDKLSESMPALKLNTEIDSEKKKLSPIKKAKDIAQTKIELENDEKEIPNLITPSSDDTIQKRRKKQKKRKAQTEDISSENIDKVLSQNMMESDAPKKKKRVKLAHLSIIENDTCKDNQINEKEKKQKKKQLSIIEQDKNVNEDNVPQKNIRKNKTELTQRKRRNYEIVDSSEFDLSADIVVENKSKRQKIAESKEIVSEKLIKKKKKKEEKTSPLQIGISKLKSDKSLASNKLQNVGSDTIKSKNAFAKARDEALEAIHAAEMRVRAKKELKKKKRENVENTIQEQILKIPDRKQRKKVVEDDFLPSSTGRLKRLPDDVVENLTDLPTKAKKRQKLSRNKEQIMPLSHSSKSKATKSIAKADGFLTLSTSGSTTQFTVINMRKAKKESLKSGSAAVSFRQRMLDRNNRESVSAYKIYLEKQRATSKSRFFNNAF
ncbi:hypothetical protein ACFW04_003275 [Cataglyphis niger]